MMDKTKIQIIGLSLLLVVCSSCSDMLEQFPADGLVADEYWNNKEELHQVMMGAYAALADMDAILFLNGELRADMVQEARDLFQYTTPGYTNNELINVMYGSTLATNKYAKWEMFYKVINLCNLVIEYTPLIQERDPTLSDFYRDAYIAEAKSLRSLMYFYLVRIFKDVPYVDYAINSDHDALYPAKTAGDDILELILEDLVNNETADKVPDYYGNDILTTGRMNRFAVYALIAEIALWKFDYDLAITYIEKIETDLEFILVPNSEWYDLFSEGNTYESIFEIQYDAGKDQSNETFNLTRNSTLDYFYASEYAMQLFIEDEFGNKSSERTRKEGTLMEDNEAQNSGFYGIYKYIGNTLNNNGEYTASSLRSTNPGSANFIIYRYSDILLMKAEALTQKASPDYAAALDIINLIRLRANTTSVSMDDFATSPQTAEEIVLRERALELAYEGKRWYDLLRYARRNNFAQKDKFINKIANNVTASMRQVISSRLRDPNSWYLPVYQIEIDNNKNLEQNPYYE